MLGKDFFPANCYVNLIYICLLYISCLSLTQGDVMCIWCNKPESDKGVTKQIKWLARVERPNFFLNSARQYNWLTGTNQVCVILILSFGHFPCSVRILIMSYLISLIAITNTFFLTYNRNSKIYTRPPGFCLLIFFFYFKKSKPEFFFRSRNIPPPPKKK